MARFRHPVCGFGHRSRLGLGICSPLFPSLLPVCRHVTDVESACGLFRSFIPGPTGVYRFRRIYHGGSDQLLRCLCLAECHYRRIVFGFDGSVYVAIHLSNERDILRHRHLDFCRNPVAVVQQLGIRQIRDRIICQTVAPTLYDRDLLRRIYCGCRCPGRRLPYSTFEDRSGADGHAG